MLGMREIESGVDFVQNVHWSRLELKQRHNQRERDERSLSTAEFRQALLPDGTELNLDLEPSCQVAAFRILQLGIVTGQQISKDLTKISGGDTMSYG
jgi:hypothetical protein